MKKETCFFFFINAVLFCGKARDTEGRGAVHPGERGKGAGLGPQQEIYPGIARQGQYVY